MRRLITIATLATALCLPSWAQMRGGHAMASRPAGVARAPAASAHFNGRGFGGPFRPGFPVGGFGHTFFHHHHHFFGFGFPWAYAYYPAWYPMDYSYSDYDQSYNQQLQSYQLQTMNNQQQIEQRLNALEDRLDRLATERFAPPQQQPSQQSKTETSRPAVLVYRDGHTQEVQNYAIVGQTLWVFSEQQAKKIPLSSLDLNATRKANQDRDIDLPLPASNS